jgi:hypothetical protein
MVVVDGTQGLRNGTVVSLRTSGGDGANKSSS